MWKHGRITAPPGPDAIPLPTPVPFGDMFGAIGHLDAPEHEGRIAAADHGILTFESA